MDPLDRILENQATIMRGLMEIISLMPCDDKEHRAGVLWLLESTSKEAYEYARRGDG